ncbi:SDR family NAD(P)-dependent oxidoreductase [Halalkalibaculum sp. DA3122]|uniref:SDR family NAD(P)-dependent oxidoreductase n=1 Tax=unclassified Halalkalibaculum TaxID=2964617 RepID=UPI003754DD45
MKKLDGKTAIVTGATRGMGRAVAELFTAEGARVVMNGRDTQQGREVVTKITSRGGEAIFIPGDVSSRDLNKQLVERAVSEFGGLDLLVPNAGMLGLGSITEVTTETWDKTLDTNLNAVFYLLRAGIPKMQQTKGGGAVVVTGSIAAHKGFPNHAAYCASKGALEALVRQAAVDYAPDIRINLVQPGPVDTKLYNDSAEAFPNPDTILDEVPGTLPMKRIGSPEEIARTVLFLASDDAGWTTGSVVTVDGGASAAG